VIERLILTYDTPTPSDREEKSSDSRQDGATNSNEESHSNSQPNQMNSPDTTTQPDFVAEKSESGKNTRTDNQSEQTPQQDEKMLTQFAEPVSETPVQQNAVEEETKSPKISNALEKDLVQVFKLLADETRLKILFLLGQEKELHVSALCERLGQSQPAVSHHLALLRVAGLIEPRRDGKHNFYSIQQNKFHTIMGELFTTFADDSNSSEFRIENFIFRQDGTDA
jgi:ArsR family transcriptional regulator